MAAEAMTANDGVQQGQEQADAASIAGQEQLAFDMEDGMSVSEACSASVAGASTTEDGSSTAGTSTTGGS
eukprot:7829059-Lingulodinium_polyedra.AAC.1